jgi:hypothetical protein
MTVLPAVTKMHLDLRKQGRENDHIIGHMLPIIDEMLAKEQHRPNGVDLYRRFREALRTATYLADDALRTAISLADDAWFPRPFRTSTSQSIKRIPPPELPPREEHEGVLGLGITSSPPQTPNGFGPASVMGSVGMAPNSAPWTKYQNTDRRSSGASNDGSFRRSGSLEGNVCCPTRSAHTSPKRLSFSIPRETEEADETTSVIGEDGSNRYCKDPSHTSPTMSKRRSSSIAYQRPPTSTPQRPNTTTCLRHHSPTFTPKYTPPIHEVSVQERKNYISISPISSRKPILRQTGGLEEIRPRNYPKSTVPQVLKWISEKKLNPKTPLLKGFENYGRLRGRDQARGKVLCSFKSRLTMPRSS